jgi:uncharacterized protein (TIGR02391 family)
MKDDLTFLRSNTVLEGSGVQVTSFRLKVTQAITYLQEAYGVELGIEETNMILESLKDKTLLARCGDLLTADDHFDRAVNQATQVLEDRIRSKSQSALALTGTQLANAMIKQDIEKSPLILSSDESEQRGFSDIIRGIMAAHRNPTHHFIYSMSRIDAARICAYIDVLLEVIEKSQLNPRQQPPNPSGSLPV